MSAKEFAIDALTRHQIYLQRYNTGEVKRMLPFLSKMLKDIRSRMTLNATEFQFSRLAALEKDIAGIIQASMQSMNKQLLVDLTEFGDYEAAFTNRLLNGMATVNTAGVSVDQIAASITDKKMKLLSGKTFKKMTISGAIDQFAGTTSGTLSHVITSGIAEGKTTADITKEVSRIVKTRGVAQAEALIRTAANHAGAVSRGKVYEENKEILEGERFIATLDSNTTLTCAKFDQVLFDVGKGAIPALHFNCRSVRVPEVKDEFTVVKLKGERSSRGANGREAVSGQSTYNSWLRKQPKNFQNDALGIDRAKLFRNGKLNIKNFTNDKGIIYSLDELKKKESTAFELAGL